jgi:hypothetical protein
MMIWRLASAGLPVEGSHSMAGRGWCDKSDAPKRALSQERSNRTTRVLGVHASPGADDGPGIRPGLPDEQLSRLLAGCAADVVVGGHTHIATDRRVGGIRALNPGSTGMPERPGEASWLFLEVSDGLEQHDDPGHGGAGGLTAVHRVVPFDVDAVARDLRARLHPNAEFVAAILTGKRQQIQAPAAS